ncbi:MAG TPA: prolyl oligopeptidase family serine peptidase [Candidatus Sulfotelmatobacter sp.]|nr:prolyl oligopeptidase family serine peptidase [Candidatus Sulfotelmatobacter sp.]
MSGGRFLVAFISLYASLVAAAAVYARDSQSADTPAATPGAPPKAQAKPIVDLYHGTKVVDNYRWLEDGNSPETQKWVADEMAYTRALLDPLPGRDAIHKRLTELLSIGSITAPYIAGKHYFYTKREGMQNQPVLYVRDGLNGPDRVLVDANQLAADGTIALDWFQPSDNGKYVAYGTSQSGSEMSTLHIVETKTGTTLPDTIERTRAASIAWLHDNSGFYYTRYPKKGDVPAGQEMYNRHVFFHELATDPETDDLIFGEGRDPEDWPSVFLSNDGRWLLIHVSQGWTKSELFLMDTQGRNPPSRLTTGKDFNYGAEVYDGKVYIITNEDAPRYRAFVTDAGNFDRDAWKEIIPQTDAVLQNVSVYGGKLFTQYEQNATSQLKIFDLDGKKISDVSLPGVGTVFGTGGKWNHDEAFFGFHSFTVPPSIYLVDLKPIGVKTPGLEANAAFISALWTKVDAPSIDPSAYEVAQEWYKSKDGTRVPMFIVHKKGLEKNGKNPTLFTAYGGFNISLTPSFSRTAYLWMEHGGVFAVANLRGGAEFGEDWHRAGMLDKKQNVFDDMIAAAEHLISEKYTDKNHLAIQGGSNGGLLMGAMMTQRPDLFRAVVCQVPLLDMLRYQNFQIAKLWIPEYGSAENAEQFKWLFAYSPYQHVKVGVEYPAILFMTGDFDTRVDPMHAKKMAALMQAEAKNGASKTRPILLRIESKAGHGAGKPVTKQIEEFTDVYSFLFSQLGVKE